MSNQKRSTVLISQAIGIDGELPYPGYSDDISDFIANTGRKVMVMGGIFRSSDPSYGDGEVAAFRFTTDGKLMVDTELTVDGATLVVNNMAVFGDVAHDAVDSGNPLKIGGKASSSAPSAVADGDRVNAYFDLNGRLVTSMGALISGEDQSNNLLQVVQKPLAVSSYALDWDDSAALEASSVVKASPGNAYVAFGFNNNVATRYFHVYNSTTVPADGTAPIICFPVPGSSSFSIDLRAYGKYFSTGMAWANSTTAATKTVGAADFWVNFGYK